MWVAPSHRQGNIPRWNKEAKGENEKTSECRHTLSVSVSVSVSLSPPLLLAGFEVRSLCHMLHHHNAYLTMIPEAMEKRTMG
jgi:hypothetical protein